MDQMKFLNSIQIIINSEEPGFSFVQNFADWLYDNKTEFNISHVITFWRLESGDISQDFYYYGGGTELIREGLNLDGMLNEGFLINTQLEEFSKFKGRSFWSGCHIIAFPIPGIKSRFYNLKGLIVVISKNDFINIDNYNQKLIESLLRNTPPKDVSHKSVQECYRILINYNPPSLEINSSNPECGQLYNSIIEALDALSGKRSEENLGLRHYSQWEILNDETKPTSFSKIFNHNAYSNIPHQDTFLNLDESSCHYLNSVIEHSKNSPNSDYDLSLLPLSFAEPSFKDKSYFDHLELTINNGTVLTFIEKEKDTFSSIIGYISCYYIKDFPYTIFTSPELIINITQQIYKMIIRVGSYLNLKLLYCLTINFDEDSDNRSKFFKNISELLADWNGAEECLIFQRLQDGHFQDMLNLENKSVECENINSLNIPVRLAKDKEFCAFLKSISLNQGRPDLSETCDLYFNDESDDIKSAMVLSSYLSSEIVNNVLIFINKKSQHTLSGTTFNNAFSFYYSLQTCLCGIFLYHYNMLLQSLDSKNYLLKKFRHEIPSCSDALKESISTIKASITDGKTLSSPNLLNILNMMELNNSRISLLAEFFSTAEFDDSYFAKNKSETSFRVFMNSYIDIFRTEGQYRGVDVYFDCRDEDNQTIKDVVLNVSNFYLLSLTNVVINAIRYSAPGTCVNVIAYQDKIEVTDIGIPIKASEKNLIFNEGYRGVEAREINEKGMGYGLFLTKRVIEAHDGNILVESNLEFKRNHYLERAFYNYYLSLDENQKKDVLYFDVDEFEYDQVNSILARIKHSEDINLNKSFLNNKIQVVKKWVEYNMNFHTPFILYPDIFFDKEIYKVTFTINLN